MKPGRSGSALTDYRKTNANWLHCDTNAARALTKSPNTRDRLRLPFSALSVGSGNCCMDAFRDECSSRRERHDEEPEQTP